ncbi:MAG: helix-turn-helix domain-containing protein [Chloroflexi bacterium]|nr:helix-turn-helix domain-containing protein [Chloroflexota bacterium]
MDDHAPAFGAQLRTLRLRSGLSQEALAERAGLGTAAVAALERGSRRSPYPATLGALAEALGLSPEERSTFVSAARRPAAAQALADPSEQRRPRLRAPLTPLIGREADTAAARAWLDPAASPTRLLSLVGPGGVGKTVLGLQVACELQEDFDAAWLVELAPVVDPMLVAETVATALGVPESQGRSALDALGVFLEHLNGLVVLDNCEHVLESCVLLATYLLAECPKLRLLATSREPLQVPGERVLRLAALAAPEPDDALTVDKLGAYAAVRLLLDRVQAFDPTFQVTPGNASAVTQVCARLEGIPLALELAAARLQVLSLDQLVARLDQVFGVLGGGSRAAPTRQQTLRATLDWSYGLLTEAEQAVFRQVAVVAGTCELEAAEAICQVGDATTADVLDLLARLVSKSLVLVDSGGGTVRYRLLEPVRQYAEHRLAGSAEEPSVRARHAAWYLGLAERARPELAGPDQLAWLDRLDQERYNLRAAVRWLRQHDDGDGELRLVTALAPYWEARGQLNEGRRALEAALRAAQHRTVSPARRRDALLAAGLLAHWQTDLDTAQVFSEESLRLSRALDDAAGVALALTVLGTLARRAGRYAESVAMLDESVATQRALANRRGLARALLTLGATAIQIGELAQARSLLEESLAIFRDLGDVRYVAMTLTELGQCMLDSGEIQPGSRLLAESVVGHRRVGNLGFLHFGLAGLAQAAAAQARPVQAARLLGASEAVRESVGAVPALMDRERQDRLTAELRAHMPAADVEAAIASGYALSADDAIDEVLAELLPAPGQPTRSPATGTSAHGPQLTPREREVVALLARGCSDRQIAESLSISVATVGVHVHHLLRKLDLHSRWQAGDWARHRDTETL